ncbi:DUF4349 domain-containing protein [Demequina sp. NBRC 110057]|uniref:DUF4349 domain-containing protein n=1 Tax=Demequina sp. NBRC 110057 TaxID=1570346 RepID=UPI0013562ABA|nr:DUF4349 domain-containing protein [Demequina sp. NBRC 110057]
MNAFKTRNDAGPRRARPAAFAVCLAAAAWLLAGCSSSESGYDASYAEASAVSDGGMDAGGGMGSEAMGEQAAADAAASGDVAADADDARSVIVTGSLFITVDNPASAAEQAAAIVRGAGGRIDSRNEIAPSEYDSGSAWLTLRIPADDLDGVVDELRGLGTVDEYSTSSADVTRQVTDLDSQISTLRNSTERIEALLLEAKDITDIIKLEDELDRRQAELESLEAQQRGLDDQVSMSTIELSLTSEPAVEVDDSPGSFLDGLASGWHALVGFFAGALVVVGVLLPWAALAAVVALLVWWGVRAARKRRPAAGVAEAAPASADPTDA